MAVMIKDQEAFEKMRRAGKIVAEVLQEMQRLIKPGISTADLDKAAEEIIRSHGALPSFKGYYGYPASICASIDEMVIHGIPNKDMILREGQIISIDVGAKKDGYHGDAARTFPVGRISEEDRKLIKAAKDAFYEGYSRIRPGIHLYKISAGIQKTAEKAGFSVVRDYVGHGIGREMHEDPQVPNYRPRVLSRGLRLEEGMAIAVEPMITAGSWKVEVLPDGWGVITRDGSKAAHYENTILITKDGGEITTTLPGLE